MPPTTPEPQNTDTCTNGIHAMFSGGQNDSLNPPLEKTVFWDCKSGVDIVLMKFGVGGRGGTSLEIN